MPYIDWGRKLELAARKIEADTLAPGELNYTITGLMNAWLVEYGVSYSTINTLIGVLECAKLELYRRIAAPYENQKRHDNGDVYTVAPDENR